LVKNLILHYCNSAILWRCHRSPLHQTLLNRIYNRRLHETTKLSLIPVIQWRPPHLNGTIVTMTSQAP